MNMKHWGHCQLDSEASSGSAELWGPNPSFLCWRRGGKLPFLALQDGRVWSVRVTTQSDAEMGFCSRAQY